MICIPRIVVPPEHWRGPRNRGRSVNKTCTAKDSRSGARDKDRAAHRQNRFRTAVTTQPEKYLRPRSALWPLRPSIQIQRELCCWLATEDSRPLSHRSAEGPSTRSASTTFSADRLPPVPRRPPPKYCFPSFRYN